MLTPAVLLSLAELRWKDILENTQEGTLRLYVDIYLPNMFATQLTMAGKSAMASRTQQALGLLDEVVTALQGLSTDSLLGLTRTEEAPLSCQDSLWGVRQTYCSGIVDKTRQNPTRRVEVSHMNINPTY